MAQEHDYQQIGRVCFNIVFRSKPKAQGSRLTLQPSTLSPQLRTFLGGARK